MFCKVDAETGQLVKRFDFSDQRFGPITINGYSGVIVGKCYFVGFSKKRNFVAFDTETGSVIWKYKCKGMLQTDPIFYDGTVIMIDHKGNVYCFVEK